MAVPTFNELELALTSTALAGDAGGLYRIVSTLMDEGVDFESVLFDFLLPTERAVGIRWEQGDYLIAEEHTATASIETVIALLAGMFDQPTDGPTVVVTTAEGDDHSLPARAAAAHLLFLGYPTRFLGPNIPGGDLKDFLSSDPPDVVVLSCAMTIHLLGARAAIGAAHESGIPVVAGGEGFGDEGQWARALGADRWLPGLGEVSSAIDELAGGDVDSSSQFPIPNQLETVIERRAAILATAESKVAENSDSPLNRRLIDEIRILEQAVEAALLVGNAQIANDVLAWQRGALAANGFDEFTPAQALVTALETHVPDVLDVVSLDLPPINSSN